MNYLLQIEPILGVMINMSTVNSPAAEMQCTRLGELIVPIVASLHPYMGTAVARLGYLYPHHLFTATAVGIRIAGSDLDRAAMHREVLHAVYRERIFVETLPLRRRLIDGLLG